MGTSDWLVVQYQGRDVWKCATMRHGVLSVMVYGQPMMPMSPADNWDSLDLVCVCVCVCVCGGGGERLKLTQLKRIAQ